MLLLEPAYFGVPRKQKEKSHPSHALAAFAFCQAEGCSCSLASPLLEAYQLSLDPGPSHRMGAQGNLEKPRHPKKAHVVFLKCCSLCWLAVCNRWCEIHACDVVKAAGGSLPVNSSLAGQHVSPRALFVYLVTWLFAQQENLCSAIGQRHLVLHLLNAN